jgi:hypothetical protein
MVDLIRKNLLKFTNNFILKAKQTITASMIMSLFFFLCLILLLYRLAFDTFDSNDDGTIDFDEFLLAISATSQGNLDDRLSVAFDM